MAILTPHPPLTARRPPAGRRRAAAAVTVATLLALLAGCQTQAQDEPAPTSSSSVPAPASEPSTTSDDSSPTATADVPGEPVTAGTTVLTMPGEGAVVTGPAVLVAGEGTAFEGTLLYRVESVSSGQVVAEGYTTGGANGQVGPFEVTVELSPGDYTVSVWEPGMGEGDAAGEPLNLVTASFTVR